MQRRTFVQALLAGGSAALAAPSQGIRLGFDTYSVRAFKWKDIQLIDYAASLKLDTIQISSLGDYASLDPGHLKRVREHAESSGIRIDGGTGCICPASKSWKAEDGTAEQALVKGLRVSNAVGASSMRCYMGSNNDRKSYDQLRRCIEATIKGFRAVKSQAKDLNVKIALENHAGDMQAREVKEIIEESGRDFVGSCLDTGNPMWVIENPLVTLEVLAPYVLTTHVRDSAVFEHPRGAAAQWVALGDGCVDLRTFIERYRNLCPQASMQLEIITGRPPQILPYFEPGFWNVFPRTPASEFVHFVELAKRGHPFMGSMVVEDIAGETPSEYRAALKEQQRLDLERSLEYAKKTLGVGIRWKAV